VKIQYHTVINQVFQIPPLKNQSAGLSLKLEQQPPNLPFLIQTPFLSTVITAKLVEDGRS
jgi:hypothetical protein